MSGEFDGLCVRCKYFHVLASTVQSGALFERIELNMDLRSGPPTSADK